MIALSIAASKILIFIHFRGCKEAEEVSLGHSWDVDVPIEGGFSILACSYSLRPPFLFTGQWYLHIELWKIPEVGIIF